MYIHGGDSFTSQDDFLADLRKRIVRDPFGEEKKTIWAENLRDDLGQDFQVLMPQMPNKQNVKYLEWKIWFERYFEFLHDEVVLIGWSLGGMFLAKYLSEEEFSVRIKAVYLLAAPSGNYVGEGGNDCSSLHFSMSSLVNLTKKTSKVSIWHSEDDFIVPYQEALLYKNYLKGADFVGFTDKNHFLVSELPELINSIKNL